MKHIGAIYKYRAVFRFIEQCGKVDRSAKNPVARP